MKFHPGLAATLVALSAPALAEPPAPAPSAKLDRIPDQLTPSQRDGYRAVFAAIRENRWQDAQIGLDAMSPGPLHAIARAELYTAKGSPKVELDQLVTLLNQAPELPEAESLRRIAAARGGSDLAPLPVQQRLIWQDGAPRRVRAKATRSDLVAADLGVKMQPLVKVDDCAAAQAMTQHLIDLGHRRIGFVRGDPNNGSSAERWRGFAAAIEAAGLDLADMPVEQGYFTFRSGIDAGEKLIDRDDRPTAIFASNDDMAAAAISVAHRRGLHVPEDLSIVGFDDTSLATTTWPEITTIRQPIAAMAEAAVEMLLAEIRDRRMGQGEGAGEDRVLDHELIVRESSGPVPVAADRPETTRRRPAA